MFSPETLEENTTIVISYILDYIKTKKTKYPIRHELININSNIDDNIESVTMQLIIKGILRELSNENINICGEGIVIVSIILLMHTLNVVVGNLHFDLNNMTSYLFSKIKHLAIFNKQTLTDDEFDEIINQMWNVTGHKLKITKDVFKLAIAQFHETYLSETPHLNTNIITSPQTVISSTASLSYQLNIHQSEVTPHEEKYEEKKRDEQAVDQTVEIKNLLNDFNKFINDAKQLKDSGIKIPKSTIIKMLNDILQLDSEHVTANVTPLP